MINNFKNTQSNIHAIRWVRELYGDEVVNDAQTLSVLGDISRALRAGHIAVIRDKDGLPWKVGRIEGMKL